jgi:hypothetical protein
VQLENEDRPENQIGKREPRKSTTLRGKTAPAGNYNSEEQLMRSMKIKPAAKLAAKMSS